MKRIATSRRTPTRPLAISLCAFTLGAFASNGAVAADRDAGRGNTLDLGEAVAIALFDQSASVLAGVVEQHGCTSSIGSFPFVANVFADGTGRAQLEALPLTVSVEHRRQRGLQLTVETSPSAGVAGMVVRELEGRFTFSPDRQMLFASSSFILGGGDGIRFSDRVIGGGIGAGPEPSGDNVEETSIALMRFDSPTSRWQHTFSYHRTSPRNAEYRSIRERRRMVGGAPCVLASDNVVVKTDAATGRVSMYGLIKVGANAPSIPAAPLTVDSQAQGDPASLMSIHWSGGPGEPPLADSDQLADEVETVDAPELVVADHAPVQVRIWAVGD